MTVSRMMLVVILFLVSFVYMGLEMTAARMITPYFGNTAYTWGSIISVFLLGSALGYWWGGKSADKAGSNHWINRYLLLSATVIGFLPYWSNLVLPLLQPLPSGVGTLFASLALFMVPNALISAIIPGITKTGLTQRFTGQQISLFHISSSVGSIVGTLITTFVLLPNLHMNWVLSLLVFLILVSYIAFNRNQLRKKWLVSLTLLGICAVPFTSQMKLFFDAKLIEQLSSPYHELYVTEKTDYKGKSGTFRFLQFDKGGYQGGLNMSDPDQVLFSYARAILEIVNKLHPSSENIFMIGHGVGTLTQKLSFSGKAIEVAELDEKVLSVSRKYFGYTGDEVRIGDGRILLRNKDSDSLDVIILDAYSGGTIPFHLTTQEFFRITRQKLRTDGIVVMNVIGKPTGDKLVQSLYGTIASIYENVKVYATSPGLESKQNLIFVASTKKLSTISIENGQEISMIPGEIITDKETRWIQLN